MSLESWLQIILIFVTVLAAIIPVAYAARAKMRQNHEQIMEKLNNLSLRITRVEWRLGHDNKRDREI